MAIDLGKAKKILSKAFTDNNENINEDQGAAQIVKAEQQVKALSEERDSDEKLKAAQQVVKDLKAGYDNAIRYEQAKIQFLLARIEEIQSGDVNPTASV